MKSTYNSPRRKILAGLVTSLGGVLLHPKAIAAVLTPRATEGPFYPPPAMRTKDIDNDLVKIEGLVREAGGEVITLEGVVSDKNGNPREGVRVEIWQCDVNGKYLHAGDRRKIEHDQGFQGFGHDITGSDGRYSFRTIKPGKYPGRTPHIHVKVLDGERDLLTTQFYEAGNAENAQDFLYRKMSMDQAETVLMQYQHTDQGEKALVNIIV